MESPQSVTSESCVAPSENNSGDNDSFHDTSNDHPKEKDADMEDAQRTGEEVQELFVPATSELQHGYRILRELMADGNKSVNWPFMDAVDSDAYGLHDYYERVKRPMWLCKMRDKFESAEYETITQFVADFRLMLENCYRYNGPDHYVSKRGQRLETMLEQKLALLSRDLREKTSIAATSGKLSEQAMTPYGSSLRRRGKNIAPHDSSALLNQLRHEEALRERESRKQQIQERRAAQEAMVQELLDWEEHLLEEPIITQLKHLWELPQIGLFLFLCQEPLNIGEVVQYELERCFAMAKESSTLQAVMTTLLSTPYQRTRLDKKPMMPYKVWEEKLRVRLAQWYKVLADSGSDIEMAATKLGLDPYLFTVIGKKNPLLKKKYHELSYYRKIWIVKSLCDHCLATQESIRDAIESQPIEEQREYILGYDSQGNTYMHFPQFCGADLRVYKQAPFPHPKMDPVIEPPSPTPPVAPSSPGKRKHNHSSKASIKKKKRRKAKEKAAVAPVPTSRPSRLRQHIKTVLPVGQVESSSSESETDGETGVSSVSMDESSTCSSSYASSSTRFSVKSRRRFNGSVSSKDNTPEPPSFRGKIRKPRDYDTKLTCHSPFSKANLEDGGRSSKDVTPERTVSSRKRKGGRAQGSDASCDSPIPKSYQETTDQSQQTNGTSSNCDTDKSENVELVEPPESKPTVNNSSGNENCVQVSEPADHDDRLGSYDKLEDSQTTNKSSASKFSIRYDDMCNSKVNASQNGKVQTRIKPGMEGANHNNTPNTDLVCKEMDSEEKYHTNRLPEVGLVSSAKTDSESVSLKCEEGSICDTKPGVTLEDTMDVKPVRNRNDGITITNCKADGYDSKTVTEFKNEANNVEENVKIEDSKMDTKPCDSVNNFPESLGKQTSIKPEMKQEEDKGTCSLSLLANMAVANMSCYSGRESSDVKGAVTDCKSEKDSESGIDKFTSAEHVENEKHALRPNNNCDGLNYEPKENCLADKYQDKTKMDAPTDEERETSLAEDTASKDVVMEEKAAAEEEMVEEEEDVEEVTPNIGPFSMIADNVECLRQLTEQFAEPEPVVTTGRGKRGKVTKPPVRKKCVTELYDRLVFLLKELEPWESKLVQATKRARAKLRKEKQDYVDEEEEKKPVEDVWESEESASEEESSSEEEEEQRQQQTEASARLPQKAEKKARKQELDMDTGSGRNTPVEDETSMSSRGRLRKRRVIPNNSEDGPKKRKAVKNVEENSPTSNHVPNILQKHHGINSQNPVIRTIPMSLLEQLKLPALNSDLKNQTIPASMSASQMLLRANLSSKQNLLSSALSAKSVTNSSALSAEAVQRIMKAVPNSGTSHPVIQQLLAKKAPGVIAESEKSPPFSVQVIPSSSAKQLGQTSTVIFSATPSSKPPSSVVTPQANTLAQIQIAGNKSRKIEIAKPRPTAVHLTVPSPGKGGPAAGKVQHYNENVLSTLPPGVIQELLKNQAFRIQTVSTGKAGSSAVTGAIILSPTGKDGKQTLTLTGMVPTSTGQPSAFHHPVVTKPTLQMGTPSAVLTAQSTSTHTLPTAPVGTVISPDHSLKLKVPTSPNKPKYACHVTVKSLLQDRAKKALELGSDVLKDDSEESAKEAFVPSAAQVLSLASEVGQQLPGVLEMSKSELNTQPIVVTVNTGIKGLPQTLKLPSKETLDSAVQAVVTSVKTTLPTAHLKVPAPSTMPSIQQRKNVTKTIQSMKAPIPVINASTSSDSSNSPLSTTSATAFMVGNVPQRRNTVVMNTKPAMHQIPQTALTASTGIPGQSMTPVLKAGIPTATISGQALGIKNQVQNSVVPPNSTLLKVTPQTFMTSQGLVQGFLTPQGLVIPQGALQQGSPTSAKQVLVANPQVLQNKAGVPGAESIAISAANQASIHGKVVKPAMLLSSVVNPQTSLTSASVTQLPVTPNSVSQPQTSPHTTLSSASSSKLLLQAVNTVLPNRVTPVSSASVVCMKASLDAASPEKVLATNSLMSGMNIKIDSQCSKISGDHVPKPVTSVNSMPEILHINQKGDGRHTVIPGTAITDGTKACVATMSSQRVPAHVTSTEASHSMTPLVVLQQPDTSRKPEGGLPAAQVLLSLSQGMQQTGKGASPKKDAPAQVTVKNKAPRNATLNNIQAMNQASVLNITSQTGGSPQKLLLLSIGGNLYTSQGIPVTLENGVLKIASTVPSQESKVLQAISLSTAAQPQVNQGLRQSLVSSVQPQYVQIPSTVVQDMVSPTKATVQSASKPTVLQAQPGVSAPGLLAKITSTIPMQQVLMAKPKTPAQTNLLNNGPVVVKQLLASPTKDLHPQPLSQSQTVNISPNRLLTLPTPSNQPVQLVGVGSRQQTITNKGHIIQMMVPQALSGGTTVMGSVVAKDAQLQKSIVIGPGGTVINHQGLTNTAPGLKQLSTEPVRSAPLLSPKNATSGQPVLSPQKISPKSPVTGVQLVGSYGTAHSAQNHPVVFQMVSPSSSTAKVTSPWKQGANPGLTSAVINAQPVLQNVVVQQNRVAMNSSLVGNIPSVGIQTSSNSAGSVHVNLPSPQLVPDTTKTKPS
ncbi:uncharacterized bromodomain-containing protein 10-like [Liolophura sinensis]|uniref:uncharacterized bromodomain-containing protein 10-like n=1 Tax=Liolophura sinensis TaxID=3198878 RepID=UPI0031586AD7